MLVRQATAVLLVYISFSLFIFLSLFLSFMTLFLLSFSFPSFYHFLSFFYFHRANRVVASQKDETSHDSLIDDKQAPDILHYSIYSTSSIFGLPPEVP